MPITKKTKETRFAKHKKRWDEAERGTYGLKCFSIYDFTEIKPNERKGEIITEPTILTTEGDELLVVMTILNYFALVPARGVNGRQAKMCKVSGVMYREVI